MKYEPAAESEHQLLQGLVLRDDAGREEPVDVRGDQRQGLNEAAYCQSVSCCQLAGTSIPRRVNGEAFEIRALQRPFQPDCGRTIWTQ